MKRDSELKEKRRQAVRKAIETPEAYALELERIAERLRKCTRTTEVVLLLKKTMFISERMLYYDATAE